MSIECQQIEISEIMTKYFNEIKNRNSSYSLRSFARKLSMNSGALSQIMTGKRTISETLAKRIAECLEMKEEDRDKFFRPFEVRKKINENKEYAYYSTFEDIPANQNWIIFAILNLIEIQSFIFSPQNISKSLNINQELVQDIVSIMFNQKLIYWDSNGRIKRRHSHLTTSDNKKNDKVRHIQEHNLNMAKASLELNDVNERDMTSLTFAIDSKKINQAKKLIRKFQDDMCSYLETGERDSVYKLNVQLFPISKLTKNGERL